MSFANFDDLLARTGVPLSELQELAEIFQLVDTDKGGTISKGELETLMTTLGLDVTANEMDLLMSEIDPEGTGEIDFESFVCTVTKKVQTSITRGQLKHAFEVLDTYDACHDGTISMKTLIQAFVEYSPNPISEEDARELIKEVASQNHASIFDYMQFLDLFFPDEEK
jgi:calmodulin